MVANLILWFILGAAAVYAVRNLVRILSGKSRGCNCDGGCEVPPQRTIPNLKGETDGSEQTRSGPSAKTQD